MTSSSSSSSSATTTSMVVAAAAVTSTVVVLVTVVAAASVAGVTLYQQQQQQQNKGRKSGNGDDGMSEEEKRKERSKWIEAEIEQQEEARQDDQVLPSIISNFHTFQLDYNTTIEEANKKRTQKYYQMARDAHKYDLVPNIRSYPRLRNKREVELARIYRYANSNKSHRTVIVMCDSVTSQLLEEARTYILEPLDYSHDIATPDVWIPAPNIIPMEHLHVTIAIPWWWHGMREGNKQLSRELVARFRQALITEFHHPFQIELERIVLLGGKTLVGLWRTVGERTTTSSSSGGEGESGGDGDHQEFVIFDRHGEKQDPLVKLRRDIVECFTAQNNPYGQQPLTYFHRHYSDNDDDNKTPTANAADVKQQQQHRKSENTSIRDTAAAIAEATAATDGDTFDDEEEEANAPPPPPPPKPMPVKRTNTIELKTPGLGDRDGFIHTTLARLPIDCLSMNDVELEPIHRLCREATATYCGHRMVVSKFRFLETTGIGGESDPCEAPIFDEFVEAPRRVEVAPGLTGDIQQLMDLHATKMVDRSATIGNLPPVNSTENTTMALDPNLFEQPSKPNPLATKANSS